MGGEFQPGALTFLGGSGAAGASSPAGSAPAASAAKPEAFASLLVSLAEMAAAVPEPGAGEPTRGAAGEVFAPSGDHPSAWVPVPGFVSSFGADLAAGDAEMTGEALDALLASLAGALGSAPAAPGPARSEVAGEQATGKEKTAGSAPVGAPAPDPDIAWGVEVAWNAPAASVEGEAAPDGPAQPSPAAAHGQPAGDAGHAARAALASPAMWGPAGGRGVAAAPGIPPDARHTIGEVPGLAAPPRGVVQAGDATAAIPIEALAPRLGMDAAKPSEEGVSSSLAAERLRTSGHPVAGEALRAWIRAAAEIPGGAPDVPAAGQGAGQPQTGRVMLGEVLRGLTTSVPGGVAAGAEPAVVPAPIPGDRPSPASGPPGLASIPGAAAPQHGDRHASGQGLPIEQVLEWHDPAAAPRVDGREPASAKLLGRLDGAAADGSKSGHDSSTSGGAARGYIPAAVTPGTVRLDSAQVLRFEAMVGTLANASAAAPDSFPNQIVRAIRLQWHDGVSEARVRLHPAHLGEVSISLRVEHGTVSAALQAETSEVRQWIRSHESELRRSLADQGLQLGRLVVTDDSDPRRETLPDRQAPRSRQARRPLLQRFEVHA